MKSRPPKVKCDERCGHFKSTPPGWRPDNVLVVKVKWLLTKYCLYLPRAVWQVWGGWRLPSGFPGLAASVFFDIGT
jgi:hypothetical protein